MGVFDWNRITRLHSKISVVYFLFDHFFADTVVLVCHFFRPQENFLTALCEKVRPCAEYNEKRSLHREAQPARDAGYF